MFDKIEAIYVESSQELQDYYKDRNKKKWVNRRRENRGYVPKKKTSKEEYLKMIENMKKVS